MTNEEDWKMVQGKAGIVSCQQWVSEEWGRIEKDMMFMVITFSKLCEKLDVLEEVACPVERM